MDKDTFLEKIKKDVVNFFLERIKDNSGISATPHLPPTIEDTYYGIKALRVINSNLISKYKIGILQFITNFIDQKITSPILIYRIFKIYEKIDEFNLNIVNSLLKKIEINSLKNIDIKSTYCLIKINEYINNKENLLNLIEALKKFKVKSIEDFYYLGNIEEKEWIANIHFVINSQNNDGGFGFYPGTTSYMENTYYALRILKKFNERYILNINKGLDFIKACYNGRGGFARKPGALASIEATSQAILSLSQ